MSAVRIVVSDSYRRMERLMASIAGGEMPRGSSIVYNGRNTLYKFENDGEVFCLKAFCKPNFPNKYVYTTFRKSKAERSFANASRLRVLGIGTPEAVGFAEVKRGICLRESYYLSRFSAGRRELRRWEEWPECERDEVLGEYAKFMLRLHRNGVLHHDLSPGNVLWHRGSDGKIKFELVDLNRMSFRNRPLNMKEVLCNFRNINLIPEETARLARVYAGVAGLDGEDFCNRAVKLLHVEQKRKARLRRIKSLWNRRG